MTDPTLVAALRDANAAQLVHLSQQHAAIADILSKSSGYAGMFNAGANDHRIVAALLLAVARMQERHEQSATSKAHVATWVAELVNEYDEVDLRPEFLPASEKGITLPAALAALLEDAP